MAEPTFRPSRDSDTRANSQARKAWEPPTSLPVPVPQAGYVFRWIRTSMMGQADASNVASKFREGWVACKAADHPEMMLQYSEPNSRFKDNIENGGLLLCKAPEEMVQQRAAYYAQQANAQMEAVDNNYMRQKDDRSNMALFSERKSTVTFGSGNKS